MERVKHRNYIRGIVDVGHVEICRILNRRKAEVQSIPLLEQCTFLMGRSVVDLLVKEHKGPNLSITFVIAPRKRDYVSRFSCSYPRASHDLIPDVFFISYVSRSRNGHRNPSRLRQVSFSTFCWLWLLDLGSLSASFLMSSL